MNFIEIPLQKHRCVAHQPPKEGTHVSWKKPRKAGTSNALGVESDTNATSSRRIMSLDIIVYVASPESSTLPIFIEEAKMGVLRASDATSPR